MRQDLFRSAVNFMRPREGRWPTRLETTVFIPLCALEFVGIEMGKQPDQYPQILRHYLENCVDVPVYAHMFAYVAAMHSISMGLSETASTHLTSLRNRVFCAMLMGYGFEGYVAMTEPGRTFDFVDCGLYTAAGLLFIKGIEAGNRQLESMYHRFNGCHPA